MLHQSTARTIYALASAPGRAGVAVFRLSGPEALAALQALGVTTPPPARMATLARLKQNAQLIDEALVLYFPAPHSFTGEDVVELHTHGSRAVIRLLLETLGQLPGLRLAEPGEFARRAFTHGKLDLAQAEGLGDLIDAETHAQHAQAMRQFRGEMSERIAALRERILTPLALLEAYIDFPEEEIPEEVLRETADGVSSLIKELQSLVNDGAIGEKIREGLEVVIIGPPNAGKSSLLNALSKREVAIVSSEAGTTRDLLEVHLEIGGYAVTLIDTAGLRETSGTIEAEGIRRAQARAKHADLKICVLDATEEGGEQDALSGFIDENTLLLINKCDLNPNVKTPKNAISISVKSGIGMNDFIDQLTTRVATQMDHLGAPIITRARHREAWGAALASLDRFSIEAPLELMCEELRRAAMQIGKITGKIAVDDLLDVIFSKFCIGK